MPADQNLASFPILYFSQHYQVSLMMSKFLKSARICAKRFFSQPVVQKTNRQTDIKEMRPLDGLESLFHEFYKKGIGFSYLLTPISSKIPIEVNALRKALQMVSQRHPLLRATIRETMESKEFICNDRHENFKLSIMNKKIDEIEDITEEVFQNTNLEANDGDLWKVVLIPGYFNCYTRTYKGGIVLAISHAIANAPSLAVFLRQTLEYLQRNSPKSGRYYKRSIIS